LLFSKPELRVRFLTGSRPIPALTCQEPDSRFSAGRVAARNQRLQGTSRCTVLNVRASGVTPQALISSATLRDRAISSSGFVAARSCSDGYTALAASRQKEEIATVATAMKRESGSNTSGLVLPSSHSYGYGSQSSPASRRICPAPSLGIPVKYPG